MKLIRTNKKGFGVHSPFVYRLISDVLFAEGEFYAFQDIQKLKLKNTDKEIIQLIFRLLNNFQTQHVLFVGRPINNEIDLYEHASGKKLRHFKADAEENENFTAEFKNADFIILNDFENISLMDLALHEKKVICAKNLDESESMSIFFKTLSADKNVQLSIKYKNFGIIIVDDKIPKQNYVIK